MARMRIMMAAAMIAAALPAAALAQAKPQGGSTAAEIAATQNLNREQAGAAAEQHADNVANAEQFRQSMADYEAARTAASQARAAYEAELEANRIAREAYDAAHARWQADVAACTAGDHSRCLATTPK